MATRNRPYSLQSSQSRSRNGGDSARSLRAAAKLHLRSLTSPLVSRYNFALDTGLSFYGQRNVHEALGYPPDSALTPSVYRYRYNRGGIARRILTAYPQATWTGGASIYEDEDTDVTTEFEKEVDSLFSNKRLNIWSKILRADILTGLGCYGAILIGAPGDLNTDIRLQSGARLVRTADDILYLTPLGEDRCKIESRVKDRNDKRFGLVDTYKVMLSDNPTNTLTDTNTTPQIVHWSRIIHIAHGCLESDLFGEPRLRAVWNYLTDLDKIVGGGAEAAWRRMDPGLQIDIDPEIEVGEDEEEALEEQVDEYLHGLSRVLRTRGTKINPLSASVTAFGPNADALLQLISSTSGIPYRILVGSERGELASTQDRNNWADRISEYRLAFADPLIRQIVDRFIDIGALPAPPEYFISWPEIEELDETSKAEVASKIALANKNQVDAGGGLIQTADEIREQVYGLEPLDIPMQAPIDNKAINKDTGDGGLIDLPLQ